MASARITYSKTSLIGSKIGDAVARLVAARQAVEEVHRQIEGYNDDNTQLAADSGLADATAASNVRGLFNLAAAELTGVVLQGSGIANGATTATRQLADYMG